MFSLLANAQEDTIAIVEELPIWKSCKTLKSIEEKQLCTNVKIQKYVSSEARSEYERNFKKENLSGRAYIQYVVNEDGKTGEEKVVRTSGFFILDSAAINIIRQMPEMIPGMQNGKPVKVQYTVPVGFR